MTFLRAIALVGFLVATMSATWFVSDVGVMYTSQRKFHAKLTHKTPILRTSVRSGSSRSSSSRYSSGGGFSYGK